MENGKDIIVLLQAILESLEKMNRKLDKLEQMEVVNHTGSRIIKL